MEKNPTEVVLPDFQALFEALPGLYLILRPDLAIVAASNAYLNATMTRREDILGRGVFEVFPGNPGDAGYDSARTVKASLDKVLATRMPDTLPVVKYDIRRPAEEGGGFEERYWSPINSPLLDKDGNIAYIIHRVEDVTGFIREKRKKGRLSGNNKHLYGHVKNLSARATAWTGVAAITAFMVLIALAGYFQANAAYKARDMVVHTYTVTGHIQALLNQVRNAEIGQRGYVLTGNSDYLQPYREAAGIVHAGGTLASITGELAALRMLTADNPTQQQRMDKLEKVIQGKLRYLAFVIQLRDTQGVQAAMHEIDTLQGKRMMDEISRLGDAMLAEENRLLAMRTKQVNVSRDRTNELALAGIAIFYIGLVLAVLLASRSWQHAKEMEGEVYLRSQEVAAANEKLQQANSELEKLYELTRDEGISKLRAVFDTVLDGLIIINSQAIIQRFNAAAERIFGYKAEEVIGKNIKMLMPEPYHGQHDGYVRNYLQTGEAKVIGSGREVAAQRKNGTVFPMELGINEFRVGTERCFVGMIRDISERKKAEARLHNYTKELERSNQELDDFAYIASHDLKEPLRGLFNHATFLQEDYKDKLDKEGMHRLQRLSYLSQRMERLVNDLLYFSRLGRAELAVQETDLNEVISDIQQMMDTFLRERNAHIIVPEPLPSIICDRPRTTEVFRNLITNAAKYNDKPERLVEVGYLEGAASPQGPEKDVFYVRDNGIGIERDFYTEIFRIFKRLQKTAAEKEEGTGVGLTFVKKIIERHKGVIWLESEPGKGTTFYFTLGRTES